MSFLGDAFAPAPPKTAETETIPASESSPRTQDPAVNAASAAIRVTPPVSPPELSPSGEPSVVTVTPRAAVEVRRIVEEQKLPAGTGLRLGVQGGGCSGFSYKLAFETVRAPLDWEGNSEGVRIFIDPKSFLYLAGIELDFQDSLMGRGFVFNNPNAKKTCGCGESFQV